MFAIRVHVKNWVIGRKADPWCLETCRMGTANSTSIEANRATTPPNLFGMDRRIA